MHPYTVYGIETFSLFLFPRLAPLIACTLIPFTVLKQASVKLYQEFINIACTLIPFTVLKHYYLRLQHKYRLPYCMHPYTVYGIETRQFASKKHHKKQIACTLIPFTVLKLAVAIYHGCWVKEHCMHPYTVYGIETLWNNLDVESTSVLHAPLYRLRY